MREPDGEIWNAVWLIITIAVMVTIVWGLGEYVMPEDAPIPTTTEVVR